MDYASPKEKTMKGLRTICSECGTATVFQEVAIDFERKGVKSLYENYE